MSEMRLKSLLRSETSRFILKVKSHALVPLTLNILYDPIVIIIICHLQIIMSYC